ncbi:MAG: stage IV sporulation protein A [Firmicutes bacterium]|nr:stage IV sporulation protein A [Bacillota bacterium]
MDSCNIYKDIELRTNGEIYIGVVGPVRTGKSTLIKRFMDLMVLPNVEDGYEKQRIRDELPQSGSGKMIMTTEPKFVPAEAVELTLPGNANLKVRMVDCVGYLVDEALGHSEEGVVRMVSTPWNSEPIPFDKAAELGTEKVIRDHSTIGIVVTTDGSICGIDRESYIPAEERVIDEFRQLKKPFAIVLNSREPHSPGAIALRTQLEEQYKAPVILADCKTMGLEEIHHILGETLAEFPASEVNFYLPGFLEGLETDHRMKAALIRGIREWSQDARTLRDVRERLEQLVDGDIISDVTLRGMDLGTGRADVEIQAVKGLFYQVLGEIMECPVENDSQFFRLIREFTSAKQSWDKIAEAMAQVETTGYGIVQPKLSEMTLEEPEIFKQGSKFGVRLKARASSLHLIKTGISTEISPVVGTEKQSEDLIKYLMTEFETDPNKIWDTNIFGKSLQDMVTEQMETKLGNVPDNIRDKMQTALQKISDEGKEYMICLVF